MMKKATAILFSLVMILGLAACRNSASQTEQLPVEGNSVESTANMEESTENSSTDVENRPFFPYSASCERGVGYGDFGYADVQHQFCL